MGLGYVKLFLGALRDERGGCKRLGFRGALTEYARHRCIFVQGFGPFDCRIDSFSTLSRTRQRL